MKNQLHSVLFVASIPDRDIDWRAFARDVEAKLRQAENVVQLAENVWMIDLTVSVVPLGYLVALADTKAVSYGLLPFDDTPRWLPADFDPKTIQGQTDRDAHPARF